MPRGKLLAGLCLATICATLPSVAFSDVRIILKNGRSFSAESCKEKGGELDCRRAGGVFSVDKGDIAKIEKIPEGESASADEEVIEGSSNQSVLDETEVEKKGEAQETGRSEAALKERLGKITQKKKGLQAERAKLLKDRQQLNADIDRAPDWMTEIQYNQLSGRAADLDRRIKRFNEEISRLDREEKEIIDRLEGKAGDEAKQD